MPTIQRGGIENNLVYLTEFFIKKKLQLLFINILHFQRNKSKIK